MEIREHVPLAEHTTFKIGGPARFFAEVETEEDIRDALQVAEKEKLPVFILGAGSNVLISDQGFPGVVIHMMNTDVRYVEEDKDVLVIADAGKDWDELVSGVVARGLWGFENLSGIPSSVGATAVQNIGAYGVEVETLIEWVEVFDRSTQSTKKLLHDECLFGYRDSIFKHKNGASLIVIRVAYRLMKNGTPNLTYKDLRTYHETEHALGTLLDVREAVRAIRAKKFPLRSDAGTAGSFFQNPIVTQEVATRFLSRFPDAPSYPQKDRNIKLSAGWIIDHVLHLKGFREGDVGTWDAQALVMVNYGNATANDVARFACRMSASCEHEIGMKLIPEVVFVGDIQFEK